MTKISTIAIVTIAVFACVFVPTITASTNPETDTVEQTEPETIAVVISCDDCDELDGHTITTGDKTYVLALPTATPTTTHESGTGVAETDTVEQVEQVVSELEIELLSDEDIGVVRDAVKTGRFHGVILENSQSGVFRNSLASHDVLSFMSRCLSGEGNTEFESLSEQMQLQVLLRPEWDRAEYVADTSGHDFRNERDRESGMLYKRRMHSVYQVNEIEYVIMEFGVNSNTCDQIKTNTWTYMKLLPVTANDNGCYVVKPEVVVRAGQCFNVTDRTNLIEAYDAFVDMFNTWTAILAVDDNLYGLEHTLQPNTD